MGELIKIREISLKYDISTRALKYYEDMGLLKSTRSDDYAYRLYDDEAVRRLEQILILRKLNIKIKDIQRIFSSETADTLLDVLGKKVTDIDDEVALLHELKEIVLDFIHQIEGYDFQNENDIKLLYEKAKDIEQQIVNIDYEGNSAPVKRLIDITEKLEKLPDVRVIYFPPVRMLRSGPIRDMEFFEKFDSWWSNIDMKNYITPRDFLYYNAKGEYMEWLIAIPENFTETENYEVYEFPGGLYAVGTAKDKEDESARTKEAIKKWIEETGCFEISTEHNDLHERYDMVHVITPKIFREKMGYHLSDMWIPIVAKK